MEIRDYRRVYFRKMLEIIPEVAFFERLISRLSLNEIIFED